MSVYFDSAYPLEEGITTPYTSFTVYVVLQNSSRPEIAGFEFGYDHFVQASYASLVVRVGTNYPPGVIYIDPPLDPLVGSYSIPLPAPVPATAFNVLMSWDYMLLDNFEVHFNLTGADSPVIPGGYPGYWTATEVIPTALAQTCWGTGARMNASCPLPVEDVSWGTLKSAYR